MRNPEGIDNRRKGVMSEVATTPRAGEAEAGSANREDVPIYRSEELLGGKRELFILHGNEIYRLIRTRNDKLILQK
jgi:hemin uptake protein HemP